MSRSIIPHQCTITVLVRIGDNHSKTQTVAVTCDEVQVVTFELKEGWMLAELVRGTGSGSTKVYVGGGVRSGIPE
jgi:hypothetical protein